MRKIDYLKENEKITDRLIKIGLLPWTVKRNINLFYKMESLIKAGMNKCRAANECEAVFREKDIKFNQIINIYNEYSQEI